MYFFSPQTPYCSATLWPRPPAAERQVVLVPELDVRRLAVRGDAEDDGAGPLELRVLVANAARLCRTAGRVVLGIEVEDDLLPAQIGKRDGLAAVALEREVGAGFPASITSILPVAFLRDANGAPRERIPADRRVRARVGGCVLGAARARRLDRRPAPRARPDPARSPSRARPAAPLRPPPAKDHLHYAYGTFALLAVLSPWLYAPTEPRARLLWFASPPSSPPLSAFALS